MKCTDDDARMLLTTAEHQVSGLPHNTLCLHLISTAQLTFHIGSRVAIIHKYNCDSNYRL